MNEIDAATEILSPGDAKELRRHDWQAADLHVHTLFSPDVISVDSLRPERLYQKARARGMNFVTFTDHDCMAAYRDMKPKNELVSGVEIKIKDISCVGHTIHINVYDLDQSQFQNLESIARAGDLHQFLDRLREEDLPFVYNHPLWFEPGERPNLAAIPDLIKLFPVIEYNMHRVQRKNEIIMDLANRYEKGLIACTDTHSGMIGQAYTLSRGESFREFYKNITRRRSYIVVKDLTKNNLAQEMIIWLDLLSSLDTIHRKKEIRTGMTHLDRLISILSSKSLREFPRLYRATLAAAYRIANSGVPAALYIRSECSKVYEIEQILGCRFQ
jgi:predicted metal-dependent phosphoesterase TrpH